MEKAFHELITKIQRGSSHPGPAEKKLTSMRKQVRSLALLIGLRIWHCHELWCRSQRWLGSLLLWLWCRLVATALI